MWKKKRGDKGFGNTGREGRRERMRKGFQKRRIEREMARRFSIWLVVHNAQSESNWREKKG